MDDGAQQGWVASLVVADRRRAPGRPGRAAMSERPAASLGGSTANSASTNVTEPELPEAAHHGYEDAFRHLVEPTEPETGARGPVRIGDRVAAVVQRAVWRRGG